MPVSPAFQARLDDALPRAVERFGTPFHLYDEQGIDDTCAAFDRAFRSVGYTEYFAVKALPNPAILRILARHGFGFDVSSGPELTLALRAGARGRQICYNSNNTSRAELTAALRADALITVDDATVLKKIAELGTVPDTLAFRVNPGDDAHRGSRRHADTFLGDPADAKFGVPADRLTDVVARAVTLGVRTVGLHMMLASNSLTAAPVLLTLELLLEQVVALHRDTGVAVRTLNLGGGIGIPYRPGEPTADIDALGRALRERLDRWQQEYGLPAPRLCFESGRFITGPHGVLATRVVNRMSKWREYAGVDASMTALMRPALYRDAYHHITVPFARAAGPTESVDVTGPLCENNDRFGRNRPLPALREGDLLLIHDTGAHGHSMGFTYNGRLRPQELLLRRDGSIEMIRRAEDEHDHFATLEFPPAVVPAPALVTMAGVAVPC
ncbi:diaminopimelate decarboxylase [Micromonospora sp. NPDC049089]|uniref:diaminopimelate decarboxylase n=1 Tax=Micromonospora sp. NPDC049089 TaxID=3155496 RepID=UPI0033FBC529